MHFAAVRTLNHIATDHSHLVALCNTELENLVLDKNRTVATFAITTLLKTGSAATVDRLMKKLTVIFSQEYLTSSEST